MAIKKKGKKILSIRPHTPTKKVLTEKQLLQRRAAAVKASEWRSRYAELLRQVRIQRELQNVEDYYKDYTDKQLKVNFRLWYNKIKNKQDSVKRYLRSEFTKTGEILRKSKKGNAVFTGDINYFYQIIHNNEAEPIAQSNGYNCTNNNSTITFDGYYGIDHSGRPIMVNNIFVDATTKESFLASVDRTKLVQLGFLLYGQGFDY